MIEGPPAEDKASSVRAVERAVALVTALARQRDSVAVGELASQIELHPATTHRLLGTLVKLGWAEQIGRSSRYRAGAQLTGLGAMVLAHSTLVHQSYEILRRLTEFSGLNSYLSVLIGDQVVYLARSKSEASSASAFEIGMSHPFHAIADGKLLVALLPEQEREQILRDSDLKPFTAQTTVDVEVLRETFRVVSKQGYAVDVGGRFDFLRSIAVPIRDANQQVVAAFMCFSRMDSGPFDEVRLSQEMKLLADELSQRL